MAYARAINPIEYPAARYMDTPFLQAVSQIAWAAPSCSPRHPQWRGLALAAANGMTMVREIKNRSEPEAIIKAEARRIGPWPDNMQVIAYSLDDSWRAIRLFP